MANLPESGALLTYEDYCAIPEDLNRHEIIGGLHYVSAAPRVAHQLVLTRLHLDLHRIVESPGLGTVLLAPLDVELSRHDIVQPDLVAVLEANRGIFTPSRLQGAPDLVVEILSPSTGSRDRGMKRELYERSGVAEHWIVDHEAKIVEQLALVDTNYESRGLHQRRFPLSVIPGGTMELASVWGALEEFDAG